MTSVRRNWFSDVVVCQRGWTLNCWMPEGNPARCIREKYVCDGQNDCFNGFLISDEFGCSEWSFVLYIYIYIRYFLTRTRERRNNFRRARIVSRMHRRVITKIQNTRAPIFVFEILLYFRVRYSYSFNAWFAYKTRYFVRHYKTVFRTLIYINVAKLFFNTLKFTTNFTIFSIV